MDNPAPRVSVIIPAYNHALWIKQAVHSVFQQSFSDWELIIIDDASTDNTWAVLERECAAFAAVNPQNIVTHRHSQNQGASATLNEGLSRSRGEYIAILNSDDVWHKARLARLVEYSEQQACDFVASGVTLWDQHSTQTSASEPHWLAWYDRLCAEFDQTHDFLQTLLLGNFLITTSNFFLRREVYERCGGFAELRYVHDYDYAFRLYQYGASMHCLSDEVLLNYRLHGDNTIRERPLAAQQENMALLLRKLTALSAQLTAPRLQALRWQLAEIFRYYTEEWQAELHWQLVAKEQDLFRLIADRDAWVAERDDWVAERDERIATQQRLLQEREHWVTERDAWVAERDRVITDLQQDIQRQQGWLNARDGWIAERDAMLSQRDHWVAQRDVWISERDGWITERDQLLTRLRAEHSELLNSRAFRLGNALLYPLRLIAGWLKGQKWRPGHA